MLTSQPKTNAEARRRKQLIIYSSKKRGSLFLQNGFLVKRKSSPGDFNLWLVDEFKHWIFVWAKIIYMNDIQQHINQITKKAKIKYLDISNRDLSGQADLSEFATLTSLNSYNNKFEDLTWLETLPNKANLKKLNFFGNQLKEIDFAWLLSTFPNLEQINLENNPAKTKNLNNLTNQQFAKLVQGIKNKKFRVASWQGTILMDLLLVDRGNTDHNAHVVQLQTLIQEKQPNEIKSVENKQANNSQIQPKSPNTSLYLLVSGLILFGISILAIGYWLGKKKQHHKE